jgi:adenylate/nucleoside-diphosphate kinase
MLRNGEAIPPQFIFDALKAKIQSEEVVFKGYVLDGVPDNLEEPDLETRQIPKDIQVIFDLLAQQAPNHIPILVNLTMSDEDLVCRKAAQWLDPKTNTIYSGQQISYSRQRRAAGWVDGTEDEVAVAEAKWEKEQNLDASDETVDEDLIMQREELGDGSIEKAAAKPAQDPPQLRSRTTWPILSDEILAR